MKMKLICPLTDLITNRRPLFNVSTYTKAFCVLYLKRHNITNKVIIVRYHVNIYLYVVSIISIKMVLEIKSVSGLNSIQ